MTITRKRDWPYEPASIAVSSNELFRRSQWNVIQDTDTRTLSFMIRERTFKVVLALVGLLFAAAIFPAVGGVVDPAHSDTGDTMMMGLYFALGVFLLIAVKNPSAHRSLIAFAAWSSFAHAIVMSLLGLKIPEQRDGFLIGSGLLVAIGGALLALAPKKATKQSTDAGQV